MSSSFSTALSALSAHAAALSVVGDNLANLNTTAFKANSVSFHDLVAGSLGLSSGNDVGAGVSGISTKRLFTQGAVEVTSGALDAAIQGDGFFMLRNSQGETVYSRAGSFTVDDNGYLVTASGNRVQGWSASDGTLNVNSSVGDILLPESLSYPPKATSQVSLGMNLNASAVVGETTGTFTAPLEIYDSWGAAHEANITFTKTGAGTWDYEITVPASELGDSESTEPTSIANGSLAFDENGLLATPDGEAEPITATVSGLANGAPDVTFTWNLYGADKKPLLTQYAEKSSVGSVSQDGAAPGSLESLSLEDGGELVASFTNGKQMSLAQLSLAVFQNPDSMIALGDGCFRSGAGTSSPAVGLPGTGGRGQIAAGALEASTVDMAEEFTNLIVYQRGYQANSRVITTLDELSQETLNLKR